MKNKVTNVFCAMGCPPGKLLYIFPNKLNDETRRKYWLDFFDLEEPNTECIFACDRHFSQLQMCESGLRSEAVPDIPIICEAGITPFKRKPKNWRNNVIVVTPRDPEFAIYRHETGVFPQNLFNNTNDVPIIKSVSCSMATQTNTQLCGTVEISDIFEEYRLNCFYCSEIFPLDQWQNFQKHLKLKHFQQEIAFKRSTYLSNDHDYTPLTTPIITSPQKPTTSLNITPNTVIQVPQPIMLPPLIGKPKKYANNSCINIEPPPLMPKPRKSTPNKSLNVTLADKLINLLNETILNPIFLGSEEDNIVVIKNSSSNNIETSTYLTKLMETTEKSRNTCNFNFETKIPTTPCPKNKRPIYTLKRGQRNVPSGRPSTTRGILTALSKNKYSKRIAKQALKNINIFENIYKTVKKRFPKDVELSNDPSTSSKAAEKNVKQTPLSRCLKRSDTLTIDTIPELPLRTAKQNSTELVFEYTPEDIIISLLDFVKNYPVLWEFHDEPFNKDYAKAVVDLCKKINDKWSLNITSIKMIRSINRILRFYRFMLAYENVEEYSDYYDKCALFLPLEAENIPRTRCVYCWQCFKRDVDLRRHMAYQHNCLKWPYKCQKCFERFRERDSYEMHKRLPHYKEVFKCEKCLKRFDRRGLYNKHYSNHLRTEQKQKQLPVETSNQTQSEQKQLSVATGNQIQTDPMSMPVDTDAEETAAAELEPVKIVFPTSYQCEKCQMKFKYINLLKRHEIICNRPKPVFKCHLCSKQYFQKAYLDIHLKKHNKQYDYMCEVCGKSFLRQDSLNNHMDTHTNAKITCNICNLRLRKGSLPRHLRLVHVATEGTIESTFRARCYHYKRYSQTYNGTTKPRLRSYESLPRHYQCKMCNIKFSRLKLLKDHNKLAHPDIQKIPCKICGLEVAQRTSLRRHYLYKHKLHQYQMFKLMYYNDDVETVLSMTAEELENKTKVDCVSTLINQQTNEDDPNNTCLADVGCTSDQLQDEIMKAVETIDEKELKIDDEHSMNEFFGELLNR